MYQTSGGLIHTNSLLHSYICSPFLRQTDRQTIDTTHGYTDVHTYEHTHAQGWAAPSGLSTKMHILVSDLFTKYGVWVC